MSLLLETSRSTNLVILKIDLGRFDEKSLWSNLMELSPESLEKRSSGRPESELKLRSRESREERPPRSDGTVPESLLLDRFSVRSFRSLLSSGGIVSLRELPERSRTVSWLSRERAAGMLP